MKKVYSDNRQSRIATMWIDAVTTCKVSDPAVPPDICKSGSIQHCHEAHNGIDSIIEPWQQYASHIHEGQRYVFWRAKVRVVT